MKLFTHGIFLVFLSIIMLTATDNWAAKPICGDGLCQGNEKSGNCPADCPSSICNNDGECDPGENSDSCPEDCGNGSVCGDDICEADEIDICITDCGDPPETFNFVPGPYVLSAHHGDPVRAVGFANHEFGIPQVVSGGEDENLIVRDLLDLTQIGDEIPLSHTIYDLDSSVDGSTIATGVGGWNGGTDVATLRTYSATFNYSSSLAVRAPIGYVYSVAISPDNRWTVASGFYGDIVIYDTLDESPLPTPFAIKETKKKRTKALAFSPDGSILASTSTAGIIQLWSFPIYNCFQNSCELNLLPVSLRHGGSWAFPIAFYPTNDLGDKIKIASSSDSGDIKVWAIKDTGTDTPTLEDGFPITVESGSIYCLDWSSDGKMIVAGGNGSIRVYDARTLEIIAEEVDAHLSRVNDVAFYQDSSNSPTMIVSGGQDGSLRLWTLISDVP